MSIYYVTTCTLYTARASVMIVPEVSHCLGPGERPMQTDANRMHSRRATGDKRITDTRSVFGGAL